MLYTAQQTTDLPETGFHYLLTSFSGHVLTITLNRPEKKNALHPPMLAEIAFALTHAQHNPAVWLIVLAAAGDTFCAGMDLKSLATGSSETPAVPEPSGPVRLGELMQQLDKPTIARVQGGVYAGGFLLVAGCTYAVAAESAVFSLPEVKRGLFPFQVLALLLDLMPARKALDLCLRAHTLSAADAQTIGLITDVAPPDQLETAVNQLVNELTQFSPTAMQFGLRARRQLKSLPSEQQQAYLYEQFVQLQQTPDAQEGMAAFLEKRPPVWSGDDSTFR
ncbi:enoyl-CoA hydratase/isomerase family protein [Spirosoma rhododendri]|uniref:Enoyl-CoA hydratase n=1 Tax=Spirosoma rhododendri TaxID=2728024 RepID=A0A7L5DJK2_9BACT|nr:enoyl-CoA hydratase-related protein [Spirosoma rhododendri]QJD78619.1 enoyl-CoA hydratase [Spirosoma rhododendri]